MLENIGETTRNRLKHISTRDPSTIQESNLLSTAPWFNALTTSVTQPDSLQQELQHIKTTLKCNGYNARQRKTNQDKQAGPQS